MNARSLAEEPIVRFYARRHRSPRPADQIHGGKDSFGASSSPSSSSLPRSDAVRQQSFSCISSSPLRLSRRPQSPLIIGAADDPAPANPSPREQVCSQPAVGFVRGHRQRAQGSRESPPATTCQRMLGPLVTEFVRNFGREGATPIQRAFNASFLGRVQALKLIRHSAPCRDGGGPLGSSATGGSGDPTPRRRRAKQF